MFQEDELPAERYVSKDAEARGMDLMKRDLLHEMEFLDSPSDLPQFLRAGIANHGWEELCRPPIQAYSDMIYDFYANLTQPEGFYSVVRSFEVDFSAKAINEMYALREHKNFEYSKIMATPSEAVLEEALSMIGKPEAAWAVVTILLNYRQSSGCRDPPK